MGVNFDLFWAEQAAFQARHNEDPRAAAIFARKVELWETKGAQYLRATKIKMTGAIQVSESEQRKFFDAARLQSDEVHEAAWDAFDKHLGGQALAVAEAWPVDKGVSRAGLSLVFSSPAPGVFAGTIRSGAPYTPYIRPAGEKRLKEEAKKAGVTLKVYREYGVTSKQEKGLPAWKAAYLVNVGGKWVFDAEAYNSRSKAVNAANPDRKPATNHPFPDLVSKPIKGTLQAISRDVLLVANTGKV